MQKNDSKFQITKTSLEWRDVYQWFLDTDGARTKWVEAHNPWHDVYEATSNGERVGLLLADVCRGNAQLVALAVKKDYRRNGIGGCLLDYVIDTYDRVYCDVRDDNEAAEQLVESRGLEPGDYQPLGRITRYECETVERTPKPTR